MAIGLVSIANWIPKATNKHSEYVILNDFLLQQWLYESTSVLGYTYISCLFLLHYVLHIHNVGRLKYLKLVEMLLVHKRFPNNMSDQYC